MSVQELLGKRILMLDGNGFHSKTVVEVKILEISPSGKWVKILNQYGQKHWKAVHDIQPIEILQVIKVGE